MEPRTASTQCCPDPAQSLKALIIDDSRVVRLAARWSLERMGHMTVIEAEDGIDGVELARREQPSFILLDVVMPVVDGLATLAILRGDPATAAIPVIFMTAGEENLGALCYVCSMVKGVLAKPFDPRLMAAQVALLLRSN